MAKTKTPVSSPARSLEYIPISQIKVSDLNPRKTFREEDIAELAESIKKVGVIQAITVRPYDGAYQLVCGERRLRASILAGLTELPASVRILTDAEMMELMVTENLQRRDVPPLEEARSYQYMIDRMGFEVTSVAAKLGKPDSYIARRLYLLNLTDELQSALQADEISIGHGELLCRVAPESQKMWTDTHFKAQYNGGAGTINSLREFLKRNAERRLLLADFNASDEKLVEGAPSCHRCPSNSANNLTLFNDKDGSPVCHNAICYNAKAAADFTAKIASSMEDPAAVYLSGYGEENKETVLFLKENGRAVLKEYTDFQTIDKPNWEHMKCDRSDYRSKAEFDIAEDDQKTRYNEQLEAYNQRIKERGVVEGFWISGTRKGSRSFVAIRQNEQTGVALSGAPLVWEKIADLKQKKARGLELDQEKIMKACAEVNGKLFPAPSEALSAITMPESIALLCIAFESLGWDDRAEVRRLLHGAKQKINWAPPGENLPALIASASEALRSHIVRLAVREKFSPVLLANFHQIATLTAGWAPQEYDRIISDQEAVRVKREARIDEQIAELEAQVPKKKKGAKAEEEPAA